MSLEPPSPREPPAFSLHVPTADDASAWFRLFDDPEIMRYISGGLTQNLEWYQAFAARQRVLAAETGLCLFALRVPDAAQHPSRAQGAPQHPLVAGFVGLQPWSRPWGPAGRTEIGWRLGSSFQGRGLATSGARLALRIATSAGVADPVAMIDDRNAESIGVATKLGMVPLDRFDSPENVLVSMFGFTSG